jgi:transcriptional regulator GlxA family with amidase domain
LNRDRTARIGIVLYDGVEPIDLGGTLGVISMASRLLPGLSATTIAEHAGPVLCAGGLTVLAAHGFADVPQWDGPQRDGSRWDDTGTTLQDTARDAARIDGPGRDGIGGAAQDPTPDAACDVVVVTGGPGWAIQARNDAMLAFLRRLDPARLASVCTGALILGAAGLLKGRPATTRRTAIGAEAAAPLTLLARHGAQPRVAQIVDTGGPITGGGVSLAHDLTLHLIGRLYGQDARDEVARLIEYDRAFAANQAALGIVVD